MSHILAFFLLMCDRKKGGETMRNQIYLRPTLYDLSQGLRIKFVRVFRHLTQDNISEDLGITGENKRRTLTRYEKGDRNPSYGALNTICNSLKIPTRPISNTYHQTLTNEQLEYKYTNYLPYNKIPAISSIDTYIECPYNFSNAFSKASIIVYAAFSPTELVSS